METSNFQGIFPYQYLPVVAQSCQRLVTVANCFQCKALNSVKIKYSENCGFFKIPLNFFPYRVLTIVADRFLSMLTVVHCWKCKAHNSF